MRLRGLVFTTLLLVPAQAMGDIIYIDCQPDRRFVCRDDETACRPPQFPVATYHFTLDTKKKTGALLFCSPDCLEPSLLTVVHDYCAFLHDYGMDCLHSGISVWEPQQQATFTITDTRYVINQGMISQGMNAPAHSTSIFEFGHCTVVK
jgi:hypothetical protein